MIVRTGNFIFIDNSYFTQYNFYLKFKSFLQIYCQFISYTFCFRIKFLSPGVMERSVTCVIEKSLLLFEYVLDFKFLYVTHDDALPSLRVLTDVLFSGTDQHIIPRPNTIFYLYSPHCRHAFYYTFFCTISITIRIVHCLLYAAYLLRTHSWVIVPVLVYNTTNYYIKLSRRSDICCQENKDCIAVKYHS